MIIVEGPDGGGKTTLVNELARDLHLQVGKRATDNRDKLYEVTRQDTYTALGDAVGGHEPVRIWDRLFFSESVYAPVVGRECEFSQDESIFIKKILAACDCPIILCMPSFSTVVKNCEGTHQMEGVNENLNPIYHAYTRIFEHTPGIIWYDYTGEYHGVPMNTYKDVMERCERYIEARRERSWG